MAQKDSASDRQPGGTGKLGRQQTEAHGWKKASTATVDVQEVAALREQIRTLQALVKSLGAEREELLKKVREYEEQLGIVHDEGAMARLVQDADSASLARVKPQRPVPQQQGTSGNLSPRGRTSVAVGATSPTSEDRAPSPRPTAVRSPLPRRSSTIGSGDSAPISPRSSLSLLARASEAGGGLLSRASEMLPRSPRASEAASLRPSESAPILHTAQQQQPQASKGTRAATPTDTSLRPPSESSPVQQQASASVGFLFVNIKELCLS
jgi:hypothetical protein